MSRGWPKTCLTGAGAVAEPALFLPRLPFALRRFLRPQVQIDLERVTERLTRDKQLEVARREDQITRPSGPNPASCSVQVQRALFMPTVNHSYSSLHI